MIPIVPWSPDHPCDRLEVILARNLGPSPEMLSETQEIINRVRAGGDRALVQITAQLDGVHLEPSDLRVDRNQLEELASGISPKLLDALDWAADNIRSFHQLAPDETVQKHSPDGSSVETRVLPLGSAGIYCPGGARSSPSSLLMAAIPAALAGVERIVAVTPPQALTRTPALAAAALIAGIDEVYQIGGAQAVAALAYGTESIKRVHKIVGPGNRWVSTAKHLVHGVVGVDAMAGPSEVVVLADERCRPSWVAADLLAQAEHGPESAAIAIVGDTGLAQAIQNEVGRQVANLPRGNIARETLRRHGAIFLCPAIESACRLINILAPEHLQLMCDEAEELLPQIHHAGAIFLGHYSPQAVGNFIAGPSCILPTAGSSRFSSPLGVYDFIKRNHVIRWSVGRLEQRSAEIIRLANAEGCEGQVESVRIRLEGTPGQEN